MDAELASLEAQVAQVVEALARLRGENATLRTRLLDATRERDLLAGKLDATRVRLEALVVQLPDT